ncbi:hypothetical protein L596_000794 [Steinernema carpocapsae]|uniref:Uncharacterized protein n=1 Tax=Steinernema carpocapsae TaxID=34508 RepID=A0A4U8UJ56_STECR|nr:hypothetical protein L596_000794 [Steinernema carpocapsae]
MVRILLKDRDVAPVKMTMREDHEEIQDLGSEIRKIRAKQKVKDKGYVPAESMTIEEFELVKHVSEERIEDATKVLKLESAEKLRSATINFSDRHLSRASLDLLKILTEKPLESITLRWQLKQVDLTAKRQRWDDDHTTDIAAIGDFFLNCYSTLKKVHISGPFSLGAVLSWLNLDQIEHVYCQPRSTGQPMPQLFVHALIKYVRDHPRSCVYDFDISKCRNTFEMVSSLENVSHFWITIWKWRQVCFKTKDGNWKIRLFNSLPRIKIECFRDP